MSDPDLVLLIVFASTGLLLVGLSIPLLRNRVPPNPWYGFRVRRTLENRAVWYPANAYSAKGLLWTGLATVVAAIVPLVVDGVSEGAYAAVVTAVLLFGVFATLVTSFAYLRRLDDDGHLK